MSETKSRPRGHLVKRGRSWSVVVELGRDPVTRKRRQQWVSVNGTKRDAQKRLTEILHELDTGSFVKPTQLTVGDYLRQWLDRTTVRSRTLEGYRAIVETHLVPALGGIVMSELQPSHVQTYYARAQTDGYRGKPGLSSTTVLQHHRILGRALKLAVRLGLVGRNVCQAVEPPRLKRSEAVILDADGAHRLLEAARETMYYPMLHLALYTGLRRSEFLGLRWKDVDLNLGGLSVSQVMHRLKGGKIVFEEPKSSKGRRRVALSPTAVLALRAHREKQEADRALTERAVTDDDLVFAKPDGSQFVPDTVTKAFSRIARSVGLDGVRLHDLRHTHASLMLRKGIPHKVVQERLGHGTVAITLDIYSHVSPGMDEAAAQAFDDELAPRVREPVG